jgi:hypothetical protein
LQAFTAASQGDTKAHRDEPEALIAATHPPSRTRDQVSPPSRVVKRAPLPRTQPTRGVGKIIGENALPGAGNSPPTTLQDLPASLVETSRSPQWVFLDHTPRPFVTLKKVTAESSDPVIRFAQGEVVAAASLGAAFAVDAAVPAQRVKVAMSATPNLRFMLVSPIYTFSAFTDCQD